jgi:hypothetical protein
MPTSPARSTHDESRHLIANAQTQSRLHDRPEQPVHAYKRQTSALCNDAGCTRIFNVCGTAFVIWLERPQASFRPFRHESVTVKKEIERKFTCKYLLFVITAARARASYFRNLFE